jgi:hypothetical protein
MPLFDGESRNAPFSKERMRGDAHHPLRMDALRATFVGRSLGFRCALPLARIALPAIGIRAQLEMGSPLRCAPLTFSFSIKNAKANLELNHLPPALPSVKDGCA